MGDIMTQEEIKNVLRYDPLTGVFYWRKTINSRNKIDTVAGTIKPSGYIHIWFNKKAHMAHRLAWLYVYGGEIPNYIDHINRNCTDNSIINLRLATNSQNQQNTKGNSRNKSGYTGIRKVNRKSPWKVQITIENKQIHVGSFLYLKDAIEARLDAEHKYFTHSRLPSCQM
jgi:hypothetical protein